METKDLFEKCSDGFDCDQVEQYITILKAQYKKVFEYAKATEANNEKLKKICRALSDENKALKAAASTPVAPAFNAESADKIIKLSKEITAEAEKLTANN